MASINIEDADTDQDWFPDVWEYEQHPGDADFLSETGPSATWTNGDTEVNPNLLTNGLQTVSAAIGFATIIGNGTSDADSDGLSDLVELILGSNPNSASTANDGYTDTQKKSIGLLGSDTLSFTVTRLDVKSADADLTWQVDVVKSGAVSSEARSVMGLSGSVTYAIEYTPSLLTTGWTTITTVGPVTLDGARTFKTTITTSDTIDLDKGFFRIRLLGN